MIAFIGGGNMASALIGGLLRQGHAAADITVVEPFEEARLRLAQLFGVQATAAPTAALSQAALVVWAVKPQTFKEAAQPVAPLATQQALHLSVAAGIRSSSIAHWLGSERVVRAMPNTPALIGQGMTGLFARAAVGSDDRALIDRVLAPTGQCLWLQDEEQIDAVTALSGSGPAYVFFFIEAMAQAGCDMGLIEADARRLAIATFSGASALASQSDERPAVLRQRVTSKGGTTHAAITSMQESGVHGRFIAAMQAARARARDMGDEFAG